MIPTYRFIFPFVINNFYRPYETRASDITKTLVPEAKVEIKRLRLNAHTSANFCLNAHTLCVKNVPVGDVGFKELSFLSYFSISLWRLD